MTYAEKIKELVNTTSEKLREYRAYAERLKSGHADHETVTLEQQKEQDRLFMEFQQAMKNYSHLLAHVTGNNIRFDSEYEAQEA